MRPVIAAAIAIAALAAGSARGEPVRTEDRLAIIDAVTDIAAGADRHDWPRVRRSFANEVTLDYTSLWGGEPVTLPADEVIAQWSGFLPGFDRTLHLVTNHAIVAATENSAKAEADFQATHRIGPDLWVLSGHYRYSLIKADDGWKVAGMTMTMTHETGDRTLVSRAAERMKKSD